MKRAGLDEPRALLFGVGAIRAGNALKRGANLA